MTRNDTIASLAVNAWINRGRVVWPGADLYRANLTKADLTGADLRGADLTGADLRVVNLSGANLSGCDLCWADLRWANLCGCDPFGAKIDLGNRTFTLNEDTAR